MTGDPRDPASHTGPLSAGAGGKAALEWVGGRPKVTVTKGVFEDLLHVLHGTQWPNDTPANRVPKPPRAPPLSTPSEVSEYKTRSHRPFSPSLLA